MEEKELTQTTLDATRSALVSEKRRLGAVEDTQERMKTENNSYKSEVAIMSEQVKKLEGVKVANQKLMQQLKLSQDKVQEIEKQCALKEKVCFTIIKNVDCIKVASNFSACVTVCV